MIKIYSKENCTKCDFLKEALTKAEMPFSEIKLDQTKELDVRLMKALLEKAEGIGFPVAEFEDGKIIAGDVTAIIGYIDSSLETAFQNIKKEEKEKVDPNENIKYKWGFNKKGESAETW